MPNVRPCEFKGWRLSRQATTFTTILNKIFVDFSRFSTTKEVKLDYHHQRFNIQVASQPHELKHDETLGTLGNEAI